MDQEHDTQAAQDALATATHDPELSLRALGLLVYLVRLGSPSYPTMEQLRLAHREGRTAVEVAVRELEGRGYLKRTIQTTAGRYSHAVWTVTSPRGGTTAG